MLGQTGRNFAAGMSGGIAYVLDEDGMFDKRVNLSMVALEKVLPSGEQAVDTYHRHQADEVVLKSLIEQHAKESGSERAQAILADWDNYRGKFIKVFPHEYRRVLRDQAEQKQLEAA